MVYKEEYAVAIIQNGKIVPEKDEEVTLAYGSEYAIRVKNKSRQRSVADIYIDGAIAVKGLVVDEDGTVDVERYIRPNVDSLTSGPRFKLARLSHPGVKDAGDDQNGLLEVRFYKEQPRKQVSESHEHHHHHHHHDHHHNHPWTNPYPWQTPIIYSNNTTLGGAPQQSNTRADAEDPGVFGAVYNLAAISRSRPIGEVHDGAVCDWLMCDRAGSPVHTKGLSSGPMTKKQESTLRAADGPAATVQGGLSQQSVENVIMSIDTSKFVALTLKLRGVTKVTRHEKCPDCGHKRKTTERFCPKCGTALVIEG